jgi:organic radical activating enzyme
MKTVLEMSEVYPAIQAEGPYAGYPAVLVRLFGTDYFDANSIHKFANENPQENKKIMKAEKVVGEISKVSLGNKFHLIITGGEPLLQQEGLVSFFQKLEEAFGKVPFVELDTNGRTKPLSILDKYVSSYNVQVKLGNSMAGTPVETYHNRIKEKAMRFFAKSSKAKFLFEVRNDSDVKEVVEIQRIFKIDRTRIWLKPFYTDSIGMSRTLPYIEQQCLEKAYKMSNRFNILIHGPRKRGV